MILKVPKHIEKEIVERYSSYPYSLSEMSDMFPYCNSTISKVLKQNNVQIYDRHRIFNRDANEHYFSWIKTEEQAYLLGFFIADGCIYLGNEISTPRIIFSLDSKDGYIVELFDKAINTPNGISIQERYRGDNNYTMYTSSLYSTTMANDLNDYGACIHKPFRQLPLLPSNLLHHLLRGLFDGDGSMIYRLSHPERKVCNSYRGCVDIVAFPPIMEDLIHIFTNIIGVSRYSFNYQRTEWLKSIRLERKEDIVRFYNYIYSDATIYLYRKREKFEQFFKLSGNIDII